MSPLRCALTAVLLLFAVTPLLAADLLPSVRSRADERSFSRPPDVPDDAALEASGAVIGQIRLIRLNVFDPAIADEDTSLFRLANRIHIVTRGSTIGDQILFRAGDRYTARLLQESERILRAQPYLRDAHIRPASFRDGVVDIDVITQDTWTLKPEVQFGRRGGRNTAGIGIEEHNLFGTGARLALLAKSGLERDSKLLLYSDPNVVGSRWRLDAQYALNSDGNEKEFRLEHPFFALDTHWAGGITVRDERRIDSIYDFGQVVDRFATHEQVGTAYLGWSAGLRDGWVLRWTAGVTVDKRQATSLPEEPAGSALPRDRDLVYPWLGIAWLEDDYREVRNLDQIARTEDLSFGWQVKLRLGFASPSFGSDRSALVFDGSVSKGVQPDERQTLLLSSTASGRLEGGSLRDTTVGLAARYHWRQTAQRTLFVGLSAERGIGLDVDTQLTLGGDNGLRGYPFRYRTGQGRWLMTVEERLFTDWYPFRLFNVGGAVFYDMGRTWGANLVAGPAPTDARQGVLRDVGVGLRIGNSRSAIGSVVHVDVSYPLDREPAKRKLQISVEAKQSF